MEQWTDNNTIDELTLLMYCETKGLPIDEKVTENISTNALIMYQCLHEYLGKSETDNIMHNYIMMMQQDIIEYQQWYDDIHSDEFQRMKEDGRV